MRGIRMIQVGRMHKSFHAQAFDFYLDSVRRYISLDLIRVKDAKAEQTRQRLDREADRIIQNIRTTDMVIVLDQTGKSLKSVDLAQKLTQWLEDPSGIPCFVLGGAYGLGTQVKSRARMTLALGPMTLPHELAAVVFMEQLYRALTIIRGHPYHH
ncbi:MAG: 23S rRNA (pseudouridine(1915)-N(3))-methyltransferase RlmH [Desulfonatronovibrionaceae bacterium]